MTLLTSCKLNITGLIKFITNKKKIEYDDLTLPQWITGQPTNKYYMKDQSTDTLAFLQVILAIKDTTSLLKRNGKECMSYECLNWVTWTDPTLHSGHSIG